MNPKLFQSAEFYHRRYHNFATVLVIPMTLLVFFLLAFSLIGKKEITVTTLGSIRPTKVIAVVQSSSNNTVLTNNLSENKAVKKGDLLIQYSDKLEDSQLNAIQTQIKRYERQQEALNQLKESLKQGQNLFADDDEFGYSATVERFLNQSQTITAQVSQSNQSVAKQEAVSTKQMQLSPIRLLTYKPKPVNIKKLKMLFKLIKQTYLAIIHMQLLLIAILAKFKQSIHKAVQLTTILLAKKALKINF